MLDSIISGSGLSLTSFLICTAVSLILGLAVAGRLHVQSALLPHAGDVVVLGLELLQQVEGTVAQPFVALVAAIGKEHGNGRIDDEQMDGCRREVLLRLAAGRAKRIVCLPIGRHMGAQQGGQLVDGLTFEQLAKTGFPQIIQLGQLRDANMRKVLGAQTEEPPLRGVHRLQPELMLQKEILVAQTGEVAFVECIFLVVIGNHIELQQTGLSHEESLNLEQVVNP